MSTISFAPGQKAKASLRPSRQTIKRAALALAGALTVAGAADFGHYYLTAGRYLETTDDAYVKANSTIIAPKVSGYIAEVLVADNEKVKAGQLLARIDDRDFRNALKQAEEDVAASDAGVQNIRTQIELQEPLIQQQAAEVDAAEADLKFAQQERVRYDDLMKSGSGTVQRAQQTDAALRAQTARLQQGKSGLIAINKKTEVLYTERAKGAALLDSRALCRTAGGAESLIHADHRARKRHGRRALAPGRPICAGRNPADGGCAAGCGLCGRQFQRNPAHSYAQWPAGRTVRR